MQFLRYLPATNHGSLAGSKQRDNPCRLQITGCNLVLFLMKAAEKENKAQRKQAKHKSVFLRFGNGGAYWQARLASLHSEESGILRAFQKEIPKIRKSFGQGSFPFFPSRSSGRQKPLQSMRRMETIPQQKTAEPETRRSRNKGKTAAPFQKSTSSSQGVGGCQPEAEGMSPSNQCFLLSKLNRVQFSKEG